MCVCESYKRQRQMRKSQLLNNKMICQMKKESSCEIIGGYC